MEKIVSLAKRRGFIYPSSEIYGGLNGFWDYGPLGVELKRNVKDAWWQDVVRSPPAGPDGRPIRMVGLDCSIIMNPKVWEASGHVGGFADKMVECSETKQRYRADHLWVQEVHAVGGADVGEFVAIVAQSEEQAKRLEREYDPRSMQLPEQYEGQLRMKRWKRWGVDRGFITGGTRRFLTLNASELQQVYAPDAENKGTLGDVRAFNLMFDTYVGAMQDSSSKAYLRPETAQGIFVNYKNVLDTTRIKVPFGIAQIGKAFRNEINPRNFTFRSREFEQMEIEFFCHPKEADLWYQYWRDARLKWYVDHGLRSGKLRLRDHQAEELAHYARACADVEYEFPFGVSELEGIANRTDFDLAQHQKFSGRDMTYFDDETKERFLPHVIEPSGGVDRAALAFLCEAYAEDEAPDESGVMQRRTVLRFHPRLAPLKVAVFPLVKKDGMPEKALEIYQALRPHMTAFYDEKGAVGRRYRRQDEAGTPFCITVDGQTREDGTVTVRDRDSMKQERIGSDAATLLAYLRERLRR
ncbi:MAG: glycine--tRNA ligase [Planctomycetes bacterium]|nr:glycine--tRNA ligase [Planctomycetota bacterium]